jgi:hypothetical protein
MSPKLARPFVIPALLAVYLGFFWFDMSGMDLSASGFPRLLIIVIAGLMIVEVVRGVRKLRRQTPETETVTAETEAVTVETNAQVGSPSLTTWQRFMERWRSEAFQTRIPMIAIIVFLVAYWLLLPLIGAFPSTALFVAGLSLMLGCRKPLPIIGSAVVCVGVVAAFIQIFNLPLVLIGSS